VDWNGALAEVQFVQNPLPDTGWIHRRHATAWLARPDRGVIVTVVRTEPIDWLHTMTVEADAPFDSLTAAEAGLAFAMTIVAVTAEASATSTIRRKKPLPVLASLLARPFFAPFIELSFVCLKPARCGLRCRRRCETPLGRR
jgi:hypothetical protein